MGVRRKFSQAENQFIVDARIHGRDSWTKIGKEFGVSKNTLHRHVHSDPFFKDYLEDEQFISVAKGDLDNQMVLDLVKQKKTIPEIARILGHSTDAIGKRISRENMREAAGQQRNPTHERISTERLKLIESYLKEGYSYRDTSHITGNSYHRIRAYFPEYAENGNVARGMRTFERHIMKKIDEVWGFSNAA